MQNNLWIATTNFFPSSSKGPRKPWHGPTEQAEFIVDAEDRRHARLKVPIYSSTHNDRSGSQPDDELGNLRPGLVEWPLVFQDLDDLEILGYRQQRAKSGYNYYAIKTIVWMVKTGDHLEVKLQVLHPDQPWLSDAEQQKSPEVKVVFNGSQEIWASDRSHERSEAGENLTVCPPKRPAEATTVPRAKVTRPESPPTPGRSNYNTRRRTILRTSGTRLGSNADEGSTEPSESHPSRARSSRDKSASTDMSRTNMQHTANKALDLLSHVL